MTDPSSGSTAAPEPQRTPPAANQPPYQQPGYGQPGYGQPGMQQPGPGPAGGVPPYQQPGFGQPGPYAGAGQPGPQHQGYGQPGQQQKGFDQVVNFGVQGPGGPTANIPTPGGLDFMGAIRTVLGKYAVFSGRATRQEFWYWVAAVVGLYVAIIVVGGIATAIHWAFGLLFWLVLGLAGLVLIVPNLAVTFRRLQDTGRPGIYLLIGFIPVVGGILLLIWCAGDSQPHPNAFGLPAAPTAS